MQRYCFFTKRQNFLLIFFRKWLFFVLLQPINAGLRGRWASFSLLLSFFFRGFLYQIQMLATTHAIVLHAFKYTDNRLIVDMLTEAHGRLSFIARAGRAKRGAGIRHLFQPMALLEVTFDYRQTAQLQQIKEVRTLHPLVSVPFEPYKCAIVLFLSEFLYHATRQEACNVPLFRYIEASVLWLDGADSAFANFHLVFMMRLSKFIGFYPNVEEARTGDIFNLRTGCFETYTPAHTDFLHPFEAEKLEKLLRMDYETMYLFAMSHEERNRCTDIILHYYRLHLPVFPELKSLGVLRDVLRG